jgi:hypothetical protein
MRTRITMSIALLLALVGFSASATVANFSAETKNPTNAFATGTLVLSNKVSSNTACLSTAGGSTDTNVNNACDTLLSLSAKKPGDSSSANLTLLNAGTLAASALKLYTSACTDANASGETYHGTGSACGNVQLTIQQWTSNTFATPSACIYGGVTVANTCDFTDTTKTVGAYATAHTGSVNAQTIGSGLAASASAYFTVAVQMPSSAGNSFQGRSASVDFTWHIDQ